MSGRAAISRRQVIAGAAIAGALFSSPANACKSPAAKDRKGYTQAIDQLFAAWWARDFNRFLAPFRHPDRDEPLPDRKLFDAHYAEKAPRFRAGLLFNGASAVVQVVTPQQPDFQQGICGGYAQSDLFLVKFYPGISSAAVIESIQFLDMDLLAQTEWKQIPGTPDVKIEPYWQLDIQEK